VNKKLSKQELLKNSPEKPEFWVYLPMRFKEISSMFLLFGTEGNIEISILPR
jgi:hypothetical protein